MTRFRDLNLAWLSNFNAGIWYWPNYVEGISGKYIAEQSGPNNPGGVKGSFAIAKSSRWSYDADVAARLWERSKVMTGAAWDSIGETK